MTDKKENRGGYRPETVAANLKSWRIRGVKVFCGKTGYSLAFVKAVQATPAGAESFTDNEIDLLKFVKAANELLAEGKEIISKDDAIIEKLKEETLALKRTRQLQDEEIHILADVEKKVWSDTLSPARDGIMNLSRICAAPCNPQDVATATKVLDAYAARILKTINDAVPEEVKEAKNV